MTLSLLQVLLLIGLPWAAGALIVRALGFGFRGIALEFAGWSLVIGQLAAAVVVFACAALGVPLVATSFHVGLLVVAALAVVAGRRRREPTSPAPPQVVPGSRLGRATFALSVGVCVLFLCRQALEGNARILIEHDETVIYAAQAKLLYAAGSFGPEYRELTADTPGAEHLDYPPFDSLLQVWTFALAGGVTHVDNRLPLQAAMLALLLTFAGALRRAARPSIAALLLPLVLTTANAQHMMKKAMADHLVALGFLIALSGWLQWSRSRETRWWRLCCFGFAILLWAKNEGSMLALCLALAMALDPGARALLRQPRSLAWLALPVALALAHRVLNATFALANDLTGGEGMLARAVSLFGVRSGLVADHFGRMLFLQMRVTNGLAVAGLALLLIAPRRALALPYRPALLACAFGTLGYFVVFLGTPQQLPWHLTTAADRLLFHLMPALALWVAATGESILRGEGEPR